MTINVFGGGNTGGPAFPLQRSVRLRSSASAYFNRTPASAGNRRTWTWSAWVKRGTLGGSLQILMGAAITAGSTEEQLLIGFPNTDGLAYRDGVTGNFTVLPSVLRDPSAWYHIIFAYDSANATQADRGIFYINGVRQTATTNAIALNRDSFINSTAAQAIGRYGSIASNYFDGYLTEVNFIDGQALTPASFGSINSTTGVWQPIKYTSTYGANGFYLNFQDNSNNTATTIGKDSSGNGNNWTPNGISVTAGVTYDSMLDVPTLTSSTNANFAVLNPLSSNAIPTLSAANLNIATGDTKRVLGTIGVSSGKWYWEVVINADGNTYNPYTGVTAVEYLTASLISNTTTSYIGSDVYKNYTASTATNWTGLWASGTYGFALDLSSGTLAYYLNGTLQRTDTTIPTSGNVIVFPLYWTTTGGFKSSVFNFGQRPFTYTPPTGFLALNTYNLPAPTIPNGATQFAATTYTGVGSSLAISNTVNGKSFQPDLVWVKGRSGATDHALYDSVRGTTKQLESNTTTAETTEATGLTAFDTGGFTVGALAQMNTNTATYVGWQWKAGGTAVTNTSGSISSQVSANPSAGFSIVTYTGTGSAGATVGHGLNIKPSLIIIKQRTAASTTNWAVYHSSLDSGDSTNSSYLLLNSSNAKADVTTGDAETVFGNGTVWKSPTSSVFTIGANGIVNASSGTYVAYCFSEIAGYSKFGSYTGNGSTNGPFVYLGFRPRWILYKATGTADAWQIYDTSRNTSNATDLALFPYSTTVETDTTSLSREMDILSNGFKIRGSDAQINTNAATYIYAAFAESPFNYSLAR